MSLKQRLFRSNMAILLIALLALIGVDAGVLILLEDTLEQKIEALGDQWLDSGVYQAAELVDHTDGSWQTLERELAAMGYELLVY